MRAKQYLKKIKTPLLVLLGSGIIYCIWPYLVMTFKGVLFFGTILFIGMSEKDHPDVEVLQSNFHKNKNVFLLIENMLKEDIGQKKSADIGQGRIMHWWRNDEQRWHSQRRQGAKVDIEYVLNDVGISENRYKKYLNLLTQIKITSVYEVSLTNFVDENQQSVWTTDYVMHRTGFVFGGCITSIKHLRNRPIPKSYKFGNTTVDIIPLEKEWFIEKRCD